MYRFALLIVAVTLLSGSIAQAASYQMTSGTIVDPILNDLGNTHPYNSTLDWNELHLFWLRWIWDKFIHSEVL